MTALLSFLLLVVILACTALESRVEVDIVYYTYIHPQRWSGILPAQLADVRKSGLLDKAHLSVIISLDERHKHLIPRIEESVRDAVGTTYLQSVKLEHTFKNNYEYTGLKLMHDRAKNHPDRIFLYFHGKGMVFHRKPNGQRIPEEIFLHQQVIQPWRNVLELFQKQETVQKVGFTCSPEGYVWFNYFWIRGSYLSQCRPPTLSNERYQYEHYIADHCNSSTPSTCFSLISLNTTVNATQPHFTGLEALNLMNGMISEQMGKHYNGW